MYVTEMNDYCLRRDGSNTALSVITEMNDYCLRRDGSNTA